MSWTALVVGTAISLLLSFMRPKEEAVYDRLVEISRKEDESLAYELNVEDVDDVKSIISKLKYYTNDFVDVVKSPRQTIQDGGGDCEDFAVLTYSLLDYLGLNPGIAIAYTPGDPEAHAFVFYPCQYCNKYYIFSNKDFFEASSVEEAANMLGFEKVIYEKVY